MTTVGGLRTAVACPLLVALLAPSVRAQSSTATTPQAGIAAVPSAGAPPPVVVTPVPSSPAIPQPAQGGLITTYPLAPQVTPASAPPIPASSAASGTTTEGLPNIPPPASTGARTIAGPPTPSGIGTARANTGELDLVSAYQLGMSNDATFRAALAERDVNRESAKQTIAAYLPSASYTYNNIPTEGGARHVATITQPVISLGGLATLRQKGPRRRFADATLQVRAQDLATRAMTAVADIIKANEASVLNDARINAFKSQSDRAERLYKGGQGTITDARDIEVRYEQALANRVLLASDQLAAAARLRSIVGVDVNPESFRLPTQFGVIALQPQDAYLQEQAQSNPQLLAARETERINRLETQRIRGSLLPVLGVSGTYSTAGAEKTSYVGIAVSAPINAGGFFQIGSATATARRSAEERRSTEEKAKVELERLFALVSGAREALGVQAKAIEAAEFAVEANSKSYEGGVRTNVDVVNAIQTVFETKNTYVQAAVTLATNYLNLLLLAGEDPEDALAATQRFLLRR